MLIYYNNTNKYERFSSGRLGVTYRQGCWRNKSCHQGWPPKIRIAYCRCSKINQYSTKKTKTHKRISYCPTTQRRSTKASHQLIKEKGWTTFETCQWQSNRRFIWWLGLYNVGLTLENKKVSAAQLILKN